MRQWWLAAVVCSGCVWWPAASSAQSAYDPPVVQGMGPATGAPRAYRTQPRPYDRSAAPAPASSANGGLFELLFGKDPHNYVARYNTPEPGYEPAPQPAYTYGSQATPNYGYGARGYSYAPRPQTYGYAQPQRQGPDPRFMRQDVAYAGREAPGTIVIDTPNKYLYLVQPGGHAIRYGIGVGRPGFTWSGVKTISRKSEWPAWTPPPEMLLRRPELPAHMAGGPGNPLGARAMYLGSSLYRIHGTTEPETIGTNVSSGCIRLINEDVIDLYDRVRVGSKVIVL